MSYNDLIGQMKESPYIHGKQYILKVKNEAFLKLEHFYDEEAGTLFYDEEEWEDYNNGEFSENRVIIFDSDYDKMFLCEYLHDVSGWPVFNVCNNWDEYAGSWDDSQCLSTWCATIEGDDKSHPEYFI